MTGKSRKIDSTFFFFRISDKENFSGVISNVSSFQKNINRVYYIYIYILYNL